jgi:hypothetical protein
MTRLRFLLIALIISSSAFAQTFICGTETPRNIAQLESQSNFKAGSAAITNCLNKVLSVNILIVTDSLRQTNITMATLNAGIAALNDAYAPICLSFQLCNVDTIYAYKYLKWHKTQEEAEFQVNYCKQNVINVALVGVIQDPPGAAGYAPLGLSIPSVPRYDLIVISKGSWVGKVTIHEFGHYFGLYHTFETSGGLEFVNGTNCAVSGDFICDTPADINPAPIVGACIWNGTNRDPNNDYYTPMLGNYMAYHPNTCGGAFTIGQFNRVIYNYLNYRNYLY